tara:strand:+ start:1034 stop:1297 length:264 start_codon:yes stop_codon:yes gene_type:complete
MLHGDPRTTERYACSVIDPILGAVLQQFREHITGAMAKARIARGSRRRDDRKERAIHSCGPLAQLAEQQTLNLKVPGSIPGRLTTFS